ncbi:MAG: CoA pyrophosphatase [Bacteroidales bacterium]
MAPAFRGTDNGTCNPVQAAVMVLLYPGNESTGIVFIKRNTYPGHHSAQISFPGGAREKGDGNLQETALRETREELGLEEKIEVLGELTPLHIPVSNFLVHPFVGILHQRPRFRPDPTEVAYLVETTVEHLLDPETRREEHQVRNGASILTPYYRVGDEKIWGATAMMLSEFLQMAARPPSHPS